MNDPLEPVALPDELPVLHMLDQVLLPTSLARVQVPASSTKGAALLAFLASQSHARRELFVAVLPALTTAAAAAAAAGGDQGDEEQPGGDSSSPSSGGGRLPSAAAAVAEAGRVVATAARVLQLSRSVASGDSVVLLEGLCRVELLGPAGGGGGAFDVSRVAQLELAPLLPAAKGGAAAASAASAPEGAADPAVEALGAALRATTRELLASLSHQAGLPAVRRLLDLLERAPAWRAADVVAAALGAGPAARLAVLRAVDARLRVELAARLAAAALAAVQTQQTQQQTQQQQSRAPAQPQQQRPTTPRGLPLPPRGPKGAGGGDPLGSLLGGGAGAAAGGGGLATGEDDDDDDDGGLSSLLQRLAASRPPREVLKAAAKEARRLRQAGGEQQPGAGAARQYLEVLADLPWSRLSTDGDGNMAALSPAAAAAAAASSGGGGGPSPPPLLALAPPPPPPAAALARRRPAAAFDLAAARRELDAGHKGLERAKRRILEYLAVQALRQQQLQQQQQQQGGGTTAGAAAPPAANNHHNSDNSDSSNSNNQNSAPSPILCLIGPPGVGKTSLARSVARALRVPYQRVALGGVRDEAEIRGHRRTYVGATHGRVVAALRRARVADPLLLLDEVDKLGRDAVRGDPASALLELLDPEQNGAFVDHYLGLPLDCSRVAFVCTANRASDIPPPLLDRLEIIQLGGYTPQEKAAIAKEHLIPKLLREHGLRAAAEGGEAAGATGAEGATMMTMAGGVGPPAVAFAEGVVERLIEGYTREAGVRGLSRALAAVCRHVAVGVVERQQQQQQPQEGAETRPQQQQHQQPQQAQQQPRAGLASPYGSSGGGKESSSSPPVGPPYPPDLLLRRGQPPPPLLPPAAAAAAAPSAAPSAAAVLVVDLPLLERVLGPARHPPGGAEAEERISGPGCAAGLVWTSVGGSVQFVEALRVSSPSSPPSSSSEVGAGGGGAAGGHNSHNRSGGQGRLTLTGQAGEVLGESARIALSWIRAHADEMPGVDPRAAATWDVHVHLPAGAVPKDGPSAGVTLAVALASLFSGRAARADTAMTGELTLRGLVLPVGGLKEKLLAARAAGLRRAVVPARNLPDVKAEAGEATEGERGLAIVGASRLEDVLAAAFDPPFVLLPRAAAAAAAAATAAAAGQGGGGGGGEARPEMGGGLGDGMAVTTDVAAARRSML